MLTQMVTGLREGYSLLLLLLVVVVVKLQILGYGGGEYEISIGLCILCVCVGSCIYEWVGCRRVSYTRLIRVFQFFSRIFVHTFDF